MRSGKAIVSCLLILFVVVGALQILQVHAADQTTELAYDSGSSSTSWRFKASGVGGYMAVRFTSPYSVSNILAAKYYIDGKYELATFNILILDSDRKPVYEKPATPTKAEWFDIDLRGERIVVTGEFYVAMKWTGPEAPALCADDTNGHGRSVFVFADGSQATYSETNKGKDGNFMIRALVTEASSSLTLVDLNLSPGEGEHIYVGDTVTATFTLQNSGTTASSVEVKADSPSEVTVLEVTTPKALAPGSSGTWKLVMRPEKEGEFKIRVGFFIDGVQQSFGGIIKADSLTITLSVEAKPVYLVLEQVKTAPSASEPFYVGDVATITYVLTNGGQMQAGKVEVKVVNSPPEIEIVEVTASKDLQPGATGEWQVKIKASKPGSYELFVSFYIDGKKQIFETEGQTGTIEQFQTTITASERPFLETYGLYAVVGLVAIVVIVALVVVMRRRGRAAPPPARLAPATSAPPPTVARPPAGKFCEDCGFRMPAGSVFCPKCGARKT